MEDPEVVAAIVAGDPAGLAEAYDRYAMPLYSYCRSILREPADAADAVQDTFLVATAKLRDLRDPAKLRSWLYAVAQRMPAPAAVRERPAWPRRARGHAYPERRDECRHGTRRTRAASQGRHRRAQPGRAGCHRAEPVP